MSHSGQNSEGEPVRSRRAAKVVSAVLGIVLAGGGAFAASSWLVGVNAGSSGEGQSASISNLTITAVASPAATNLLYPGATGDVVININNPNAFPVTITGVTLPTSTTYAAAYTTSALTTAVAGCSAVTSLVGWSFAGTAGSHTLTTAVTVPASTSSFTVTLVNDATMANATPLACAATFFSMPSLVAVAASGGAATVSTSGMTSGWTS
jgi:hypothetical protein